MLRELKQGGMVLKIKRALVSVSDKTGLVDFCAGLKALGVELVASGGTFKALADASIGALKLSNYTGSKELLEGRVKTLHPKIHAGILAKRENNLHLKELEERGIPLIDLVIVNLYPFAEVLRRGGTEEELIENIDIGGVALLRAAAKNYSSVAVVCDPKDYVRVLEELKDNNCELSLSTRKKLASKAFHETASYDSIISAFFEPLDTIPAKFSLSFEKVQGCRYGENPHQKAAVYRGFFPEPVSILNFKQLNGKELSFNNFLDFNAAVSIAQEFSEPCAVIVKHSNPCGVAVAEKTSEAFKNALECDKKSAFGSIIALNRECDAGTAEQITSFFNELVIAPSFEESALAELKKKKNLRVIEMPVESMKKSIDFRRIAGGLLLQENDSSEEPASEWKIVSKKQPSEQELSDLGFAWRVVKHVKSNAIVVAKDGATLGIGAGQMNRVNAVTIALANAGKKAENAVLASDAFFPFRDSIDLASKHGIKAFVTPGGSIRDGEVILAADEKEVSLAFTGVRHFRH